jgi:hypothetical protein
MSLPYFVVFQIVSLITALIYIRSIRLFGLQVMVPLLFFVCGIEILASNPHWWDSDTNIQVHRIYILVSPVFYFFLFLNILKFKAGFKKIYLTVFIVCFIFFIVDYFSIKPGKFNYYSLAISMISYLILSCIVLSQIVSDDTRHLHLTKEPYFWITTGIIIFGLVTVVIIGLHAYIVKNKIQLGGNNLHRVIMPMANVVLYSCFAYAFYLCKNYKKDETLS